MLILFSGVNLEPLPHPAYAVLAGQAQNLFGFPRSDPGSRFFRIPGTEESKGVGLGLAIAKEIVVSHGGIIGLRSTPGDGKTARLAAQLNAQWYAVYVRTPSESPIKIDATVQRQITETLEAAQKMGGLVISLKHENVAQALISFVKEYGITHVVLGRPAKKSLRLFGRPLHDELMRELPGVDLVII